MNKTELIVFKYKQTSEEAFQDTYLAPSSYGLVLGLEFSGDVSNLYQVGQVITIDKTNKTINSWADGQAFVLGIEPSSIYPPPGTLVFTNRPLQLPIVFSSGENGIIKSQANNNEYELYESLDLLDNEPFPLNYNIADIREPEKRNAYFSKTITLPGTKKNNIFFNNIFEVGADSSFDPRKKVRCVVYTEGLEQLNGILQLTKIIRDDFNNIKYEVLLQGQLGNIFAEIGESKLCELGFQEYNHQYVVSAITNSWNTSITKNGQDYINWTTGATANFIDTEFNDGKVNLVYSSPHNFEIGDSIWIDKDDPTLNHMYEATNIVVDIPANNKITINKGWGDNSVNESGTSYVKCPTGEGYVYPIFEYDYYTSFTIPGGGRVQGWSVENLYPQLYVKTVVDKIFSDIGYTYESEFFNSCFFKRLVLPFTGEYYEKSTFEIQQQEFRAGITGSTTHNYNIWNQPSPTWRYVNYNVDFSSSTNPDLYDNNSNYVLSTPSSRFISQYNTTMSFQSDLRFNIDVNPPTTDPVINNVGYWYWATFNTDGSTSALGRIDVKFTMYRKRSGNFTAIAQQTFTWVAANVDDGGNPISLILIPYASAGGYSSSDYVISLQANDIDIIIGDEVFCEIDVDIINPPLTFAQDNIINYTEGNSGGVIYYPTTNIDINIKNDSSRFFNTVSSNRLKEGDTFDFTKFFDCNIKQSDFLLSLIKMFNLYIDDIKGESNKVRIEPRNDYYSQGKLKDWTQKLDISKSIDIIPLGDVLSKDYEFSYKADSDFYNQDYTTKTNEIYANKEFTIENEFIGGLTKNEVIFSPSPQILKDASFMSYCRLRKQELNTDTGITTYKRLKANIRILYYGGLITFKGYDYSDTSVIKKNKFAFGGSNPATYQLYEYYPYAGMLDHPLFSYKNLWFGNPVFTYYFINYVSNNNLFNFYHKSYYQEISSKNSKLIRASFYLTPKDIFELDFRNTFYIDGQYYRLNKISDYNPLNNAPTQVELFKVEDVLLFRQQENKTTNTGNGNGDKPFDDPFDDVKDSTPFGNLDLPVDKTDTNIIGRNNFLSNKIDNVNIVGDDNRIFDDAYNVNIIGGSQNVIGSNSRNVTIIGTDGITTNESNITIINGVKYSNGVLIAPMNIIDAGIDQVYSLASSTTTNIFDANEDIVQSIGSSLNNNSVDGSLDISYEV